MSYVEELHARHKERRARIEARAYQVPLPAAPIAGPITKENYHHAKWLQRQAEINPPPEPPKQEPPIPSFGEILEEVCAFYNVTMLALKSPRREQKIVRPRQVACYLAYDKTGLSMPQVGRLLGNRDHTTIMHAVRKIKLLLEQDRDEALALAIVTIRRRLQDRVNERVVRVQIANSLT